MGYAEYVGRVGTLAVALGVGFAVATTPGVAWADAADAGDTGSDTATPPATPGAAVSTTRTEDDATANDLHTGRTMVAHSGITSVLAHPFGFALATGQRGLRLGRPAYTPPQPATGTDNAEASPTALSPATPVSLTHDTTPTYDLPTIANIPVTSAIPHRMPRITAALTTRIGAIPDSPPAIAQARSTTRPSAPANIPAVATLSIADAATARPVITVPITLPAPTRASLAGAPPTFRTVDQIGSIPERVKEIGKEVSKSHA